MDLEAPLCSATRLSGFPELARRSLIPRKVLATPVLWSSAGTADPSQLRRSISIIELIRIVGSFAAVRVLMGIGELRVPPTTTASWPNSVQLQGNADWRSTSPPVAAPSARRLTPPLIMLDHDDIRLQRAAGGGASTADYFITLLCSTFAAGSCR